MIVFLNALCTFDISAVASINEMEVKRVCVRKMCMKMISVIQRQNPTGSIAFRLSADALSYSICYASDKLR